MKLRKWVAGILVIAMTLGYIPSNAFASGTSDTTGETTIETTTDQSEGTQPSSDSVPSSGTSGDTKETEETKSTESEKKETEAETKETETKSESETETETESKAESEQSETDTEKNKGTYSVHIIPPRGGTVYFYSDDEVDLQAATEGVDKDSIYTMQAKAGDKVTLQVDALEMYKANTIHVIDAQTEETLQEGKAKDGLFTFEMPEADVRIMADFVADTSGKHVITEFLDNQDLFAITADADELVNSMPAYLTACFDDDSAGMVPGSWEIVGNEQDGDDLILSMRFSLPEGYSLADGVELPTIKLTGVGFYAVDATAATPTWDNAKGAYKLTGTGGQVNYGTLESNDPVTIKSEGDGNSDDSKKVYYGATSHFYTRKVITDNSKVVYCLYPEKNPPSTSGTKSKIYNLHPCIYNGGTNIGHYAKHWNLMKALFYSNDSWTSANGRFFTWQGKNGKTLADIMREYKKTYPKDIFFKFNDSEAKMAHWLVHMLATRAYGDATWDTGLSSAQISTINALWTALTSQFDTPANPELRIAVEGTTNIKSSAHFGVSASGNGQWVQKSSTYKVYGTNGNQVTLTMSGGVKLYKGNESHGYSGSVTLSSGDTFHLEGALTQSGSFSQSNISGKYKDRYDVHLAVIYDTGGTYQDLAYLTRTANYSPNAAIEVDWINPGSVTVKKNWNDNNNSSGIRPSSINVSLWYSTDSNNRRGTKWGDYTLNSSNGWTQTVSVPTTNENGNVLYWQFYEDNVPNGYSASTSQSGSTFTITNTPTYGHAYVQKISSDTWLTDNNSHYSLAGAKYTVYSDAALKNAVGVLTTNASGTTNTIDLNPGTYYVKETSASQGFTLDPKTYTVNVASGQTASVTSYEIPLVSMTIHKTWNDDNNKFGTRPSSLTMELFSWSTDYSKQHVVKTITISEAGGWTGTVTGLPQKDGNGNALYYAFREKGVPNYYNYSGDAGGTTNSEKTGFDSYITNTLQKGYLKLQKTSLKPDLTNGNANYSLKDAVYTVYTDSNCTTKAKYFGELKTDANGAAGPVEILPGTYYVKETTAPKGFKLSDEVFTVTVTDKQTVNINAVDTPIYSKLSLKKVSADEGNENGLTKDNDCYSLEGAEYYVYTDAECKTRAKDADGKEITLVTKADGTTDTVTVVANTYYIREMKASKGYYLDDCNTKTPHNITLELGKDGEVTCIEEPMNDPFAIEIAKLSADGGTVSSEYSLEGTEFTVNFYPTYGLTDADLATATPAKTWVLTTKESTAKPGTYRALFRDAYLVTEKSDDFYRTESGTPIVPLGTVTIAETKSAPNYTLEGYLENSKGTQLTDDPTKPLIIEIHSEGEAIKIVGANGLNYEDLNLTAYDEQHEGSIKIVKSGSDRKPLEGVTFVLYDLDGNVIKEAVTDANGEISFTGIKLGKYQLVETKTVDGNQLLKDPIEVEFPLIMTPEEVEAQNVDKDKCVYDETNDQYLIFDLTYNVTNSANLVIPATGGFDTIWTYLPLCAGLSLIMGVGTFYIRRKKKTN